MSTSHLPASVFFQIIGKVPAETDQLACMFTPRPNGWPAPLTVLKAGGPVSGSVEDREQISGRSEGKVTKEKMSKVIIEEIVSKVLEGGAKECCM